MNRRAPVTVPVDLRGRLEAVRLDLLALFRALDRMNLTPAEIPQRLLPQLFELDADFAQALWACDQPPGAVHLPATLRDILASLGHLPAATARLRNNLPSRAHSVLAQLEATVRNTLPPRKTDNMVPGRDPKINTDLPEYAQQILTGKLANPSHRPTAP